MARQNLWRWLHGLGLLLPTGVFGLAALLFLTPTDALVWPSSIVGTTYRAEATVGTVILTRRDGHWEGEVSDFPFGTATHFSPDTYHGFFVVHLADGRIVALTDRSAHFGRQVVWYDPLKSYDGRWRIPGFVETYGGSYYTAEGQVIGGPAPRPLDPYPLNIEGGRIRIADQAACPPESQSFQLWCSHPRP